MRIIKKVIILFIMSNSCWAKVDLNSTRRMIIPVDNVTPKITYSDIEKVIPLDLKSGEKEQVVFSRIADRGFSFWYNASGFNETSLGRFANEAQEKFKTDVVVPGRSSSGLSHKFSFKVEVFQALAKMEYTGWLKAAIRYDARATATDILFKEKIFNNKDLILNHRVNKDQDLSMIGLAWSW